MNGPQWAEKTTTIAADREAKTGETGGPFVSPSTNCLFRLALEDSNMEPTTGLDAFSPREVVCLRRMVFILLFLLKLFTPIQQTIASEAFIKVTKFQVPAQVRVGETFPLACFYDISKEQRLYAMKMFKDGKEFYRWLPSENTRKTFRVSGVNIEPIRSKPLEVLVRNAEPQTAGRYRCMITVEGTFNSISQERDLRVINRTSPMQSTTTMADSGLQIVGGSGGVLANNNRQQQQRHAVQMRKQLQQQQQQQQKFTARGQMASTSPVQEGQQGPSSVASTSTSSAAAAASINWPPSCAGPIQLVVHMSTLMLVSLLVRRSVAQFSLPHWPPPPEDV